MKKSIIALLTLGSLSVFAETYVRVDCYSDSGDKLVQASVYDAGTENESNLIEFISNDGPTSTFVYLLNMENHDEEGSVIEIYSETRNNKAYAKLTISSLGAETPAGFRPAKGKLTINVRPGKVIERDELSCKLNFIKIK